MRPGVVRRLAQITCTANKGQSQYITRQFGLRAMLSDIILYSKVNREEFQVLIMFKICIYIFFRDNKLVTSVNFFTLLSEITFSKDLSYLPMRSIFVRIYYHRYFLQFIYHQCFSVVPNTDDKSDSSVKFCKHHRIKLNQNFSIESGSSQNQAQSYFPQKPLSKSEVHQFTQLTYLIRKL